MPHSQASDADGKLLSSKAGLEFLDTWSKKVHPDPHSKKEELSAGGKKAMLQHAQATNEKEEGELQAQYMKVQDQVLNLATILLTGQKEKARELVIGQWDKDGDGKDDNTGMTQEEMAEAAAAPEESKLLHLTAEQIENFEATAVVDALLAAVETTPDINIMLIEVCCKRLRVLCREPENCKKCDEAGSARAVVGAMAALPDTPTVQLQALAALVKMCDLGLK